MFCVLVAVWLLCCSGNADNSQSAGASSAIIVVHLDTLLEIDGHSMIPSLFGVMSVRPAQHCTNPLTVFFTCSEENNNITSQSSRQYIRSLRQHNIDTVGLEQPLSSILPAGNDHISILELQYWLMSGNARSLYEQTGEYRLLNKRWLRSGGAQPFLFLNNDRTNCSPPSICLSERRMESMQHLNNSFDWWALLLTGYLDLVKKADSALRLVHIWNEPDIVSRLGTPSSTLIHLFLPPSFTPSLPPFFLFHRSIFASMGRMALIIVSSLQLLQQELRVSGKKK